MRGQLIFWPNISRWTERCWKEKHNGGHISSNPDPNKQGVIEFWDFMKQIGYIKSDINIEDHVNTAIYKSALESVLKSSPNDEIYKKLKADFKE